MKLNKVLYVACFFSIFLTVVNTVNAMTPEAMSPRLPKFVFASEKTNQILSAFDDNSYREVFAKNIPVISLNDILEILNTHDEIVRFSQAPNLSGEQVAQMRKIAGLLIQYLRNEILSKQEEFSGLFASSAEFWKNLSPDQKELLKEFHKKNSDDEDLYGPVPCGALTTMAFVMGCSTVTVFYILNFVIDKIQVSTNFIE